MGAPLPGRSWAQWLSYVLFARTSLADQSFSLARCELLSPWINNDIYSSTHTNILSMSHSILHSRVVVCYRGCVYLWLCVAHLLRELRAAMVGPPEHVPYVSCNHWQLSSQVARRFYRYMATNILISFHCFLSLIVHHIYFNSCPLSSSRSFHTSLCSALPVLLLTRQLKQTAVIKILLYAMNGCKLGCVGRLSGIVSSLPCTWQQCM